MVNKDDLIRTLLLEIYARLCPSFRPCVDQYVRVSETRAYYVSATSPVYISVYMLLDFRQSFCLWCILGQR